MAEIKIDCPDVERVRSALAGAAVGATIALGSGRYVVRQPLVVERSVTLVGDPGTVLDGEGQSPLFHFFGEEQSYALRGITMQGGLSDFGGAINAMNKNALRIEQCRFKGNHAVSFGGAVFLRQTTGIIECCVFEANGADRGGGAIEMGNACRMRVDRTVFTHNAKWAVLLSDNAVLELYSSTFKDNAQFSKKPGGGALYLFGARSYGPTALVHNSIFGEPGSVATSTGKAFSFAARGSIVPEGLFKDPAYQDLGQNITGAPRLVEAAPGLWALAAGAPGRFTADVAKIPKDATDILGHPLVRGGRADPGAIARKEYDIG
jgi:hypothetical protein